MFPSDKAFSLSCNSWRCYCSHNWLNKSSFSLLAIVKASSKLIFLLFMFGFSRFVSTISRFSTYTNFGEALFIFWCWEEENDDIAGTWNPGCKMRFSIECFGAFYGIFIESACWAFPNIHVSVDIFVIIMSILLSSYMDSKRDMDIRGAIFLLQMKDMQCYKKIWYACEKE